MSAMCRLGSSLTPLCPKLTSCPFPQLGQEFRTRQGYCPIPDAGPNKTVKPQAEAKKRVGQQKSSKTK